MRVNVEEKLAAILVADVPELERLLARDRRAARAALQLYHHEVIDAAIAIHGGRIFELDEGRTLAEFGGPLAAVHCAVEIQETLASRSADVAPAERIRLRIGLHYGGAVVDRGELTGEALTIARRVQAAAAPGEICVSRTVVEAVKRRVEHRFEDLADLAAPGAQGRAGVPPRGGPGDVAPARAGVAWHRRPSGADRGRGGGGDLVGDERRRAAQRQNARARPAHAFASAPSRIWLSEYLGVTASGATRRSIRASVPAAWARRNASGKSAVRSTTSPWPP